MESNLNICILGSTGSGKSSMGNLLSKSSVFKASSEANSCTFDTAFTTYFDTQTNKYFKIIDTPGLGDSRGTKYDTQNIANMAKCLKNEKFINAFLIVFNGSHPRFDEQLKGVLDIFIAMFGSDFFKNTMLVFSHWKFDKRSKVERKKNKETEDSKEKEFNDTFYRNFHNKSP